MRAFLYLQSLLCAAASAAVLPLANAAPVINEIHYHPQDPEDPRQEFVELYNPTDTSIVLDQWRLTRAVDFLFPSGTVLGARGYLVVVADVAGFRDRHPGVSPVLGPWTGRLRNDTETVRLVDAEGDEIDEVVYADEGDWSIRIRGPEDHGHEGWIWSDAHDGAGRSLELVQPDLTNRHGGNWASSQEPGGTPGKPNSVRRSNTAPLVFDVIHEPVIPRAHQTVTVSATLRDEGSAIHAVLFYRSGDDEYQGVEMASNAEGRVEGLIPAHGDREIVSFFIKASDGERDRFSPTPAPGASFPPAPFLYQVEDRLDSEATWDPAAQPVFRIIMADEEREELAALGASATEAESNAQMNATFIGIDGAGVSVHYQCGLRNRGASSRQGPPNNYLLVFRNDDRWRGLPSIKLNTRNVPSQVLGPVLFQRAGVETADALPVKLRINGEDAAAISPGHTFGSYARVESYGNEFLSNHFPGDDEGNLYQVRDDEETGEEGDLRYEGPDSDAYRDTYFKQTNEREDDWEDLIELTNRLNQTPRESFIASLSKVMDIDQWLRTIAMDALLGNREGGLTSAKGDDYVLYRGDVDRRFRLIPHDLDTLLGQGRTPNPDLSIWVYGNLSGLQQFFAEPEIMQRYQATLVELVDSVYRPDVMNPLIDQVLAPWVTVETREGMKAFVATRREGVLAQIPRTFTAGTDLAMRHGYAHTLDGDVVFGGTVDVVTTRSLFVNGREADLDFRRGTWSLETTAADGVLHPGVNRVWIEGRSQAGGAGEVTDSVSLKIWFETESGTPITGTLAPNGFDVGQVRLLMRDSYYPGVPILVRVELTDLGGARKRDIWDAMATLRSEREDVSLTPNRVRLYNGVGSALVSISSKLGDDVGDFTLFADVSGTTTSKELISLAGSPVMVASGTLSDDSLHWSGLVRVIDDVIVPAGKTLDVSAGTLVLLDGTSTPLDSAGTDLIVEGHLRVTGTFMQPVTFTAAEPSAPWGEIRLMGDTTSELRHTVITRAGHAPRRGHTNTGPAINIDGGQLELDRVSVTDLAGKVMQADDCSLRLSDCLFSRAVMGPEVDQSGLLMTDTYVTEMLGVYREDGIVDDDDGLYLHGAGPGQSLIVDGCVIARVDDDGLDTLNAVTSIENTILRDCRDKGVSINDGRATVRSCLIVDSGIGLQAKSNGVNLMLEQSTIANVSTGLLLLDDPEAVSIDHSIVRAREMAVERRPADLSAIHIDYSNLSMAWEGMGNQTEDPLFVDADGHDFRLQVTSPARDAGDPAGPLDSDLTPLDLGMFAFSDDPAGPVPLPGEVVWRTADGPIRVDGDMIVPEGVTLRIEGGTTVYVAPEATITVNGVLKAEGSAEYRIRFTSDPAEPFVADIHELLPAGPPHWGGIHFRDSLSEENVLSHVDIGYAQSLFGSVGIFQSEVLIEHCAFHGTRLRMIYADRSSVTVRACTFPDMFGPEERADSLGLDNVAEHIKGVGKYPEGGHFLIERNFFGTNRGHNDVIDVDSGIRPAPILEVRDNMFSGAGDELLDLGGDALIEGNVFFNVFKDDETSDRGYANAISAGDTVADAVVMVTRNVFWDVDHAMSLKRNAAAVFEHNTVYRVHDDFEDRFGNPNVGSVIGLLADETPGRGAQVTGNIFVEVPRIFGNADAPEGTVSALRFDDNLVDPAMPDASVAERAESVFTLGNGENVLARAVFRDPENGDFRLKESSPYRHAGPFGQDFGAFVSRGAWIEGIPLGRTPARHVDLTIGGPGIVAFRYRLDDGAWSERLPVGNGFDPDSGTRRVAFLRLEGLASGVHTVAVIGQDYAGKWQREEEATVSSPWEITTEASGVLLSEILASNTSAYSVEGNYPDAVELINPTPATISLQGWQLTDHLDADERFTFGTSAILEPGAYLVVADLPFGISGSGESLFLLGPNGERVDEVTFGIQASDYSLSRFGARWEIGAVSMGAPNEPLALGDQRSVYISEWLGAASWRVGGAYVELHNPLTQPVSLAGMALGENLSLSSRTHVFPPFSFLGPNAFLRCPADGEDPAAGAHRLPFRLDLHRGQLALTDAAGSVIDFVLTDPQARDIATTRGASGERTFTDFPTPGTANEIPARVLDRWKALLDGLRITEIMYHPRGDGLLEFIEFRNVGAVPLDLEGVRLTEGVAFSFPAVRLDPGEEIVVVADREVFRRNYGEGSDRIVAGQFVGRLDNGGETIRLELPQPYSLAILSFQYDDEWAAPTDGEGRSLVVISAGWDAERWRVATSWRAGSVDGGDPAGFTAFFTERYAAWQAFFGVGDPWEDSDADTRTNLWEYVFGTDPTLPGEPEALHLHWEAGEIVVALEGPPRRDTQLLLQVSTDLQRWETQAARGPDGAWTAFHGAVVEGARLRLAAGDDRFIRYAVDLEE